MMKEGWATLSGVPGEIDMMKFGRTVEIVPPGEVFIVSQAASVLIGQTSNMTQGPMPFVAYTRAVPHRVIDA